MRTRTSLLRLIAVASALTAMLAGITSAASASPTSTTPTTTTSTTTHLITNGMTAVGFNAAIAKAHGYKIVTYANGDQQSVPIASNSKLAKSLIVSKGLISQSGVHTAANSDNNTVTGNCGNAWIAVMQTGYNQVQVASGFTVFPSPAADYSWDVQLNDANGTSHQTAGGFLWSRYTWGRSWNGLSQSVWTQDFVASGLADLDDGTICYAGRPNVSIGDLNTRP